MSALEKHYTTVAVAKLWSITPETVRRIFREVPGVLKITRPETRFKRKYTTYLIPESVLQAVHAKLRKAA
jgi:hypothetical protein